MKQHLWYAGKIFLDRLLFNFVTLVLLPFFIAMIDSFSLGPILFSAAICMVYLGIVYDTLWKVGKHDRQSYATEKPYPLKGLVIGLIGELPFWIAFLILLANPASKGVFAFYRVLCIGTYMGFVPETHFTAGYGLVLLIAPAFCALGYLLGHRKPKEEKESLMHRLMYKEK